MSGNNEDATQRWLRSTQKDRPEEEFVLFCVPSLDPLSLSFALAPLLFWPLQSAPCQLPRSVLEGINRTSFVGLQRALTTRVSVVCLFDVQEMRPTAPRDLSVQLTVYFEELTADLDEARDNPVNMLSNIST